jgi:hypothetical protein
LYEGAAQGAVWLWWFFLSVRFLMPMPSLEGETGVDSALLLGLTVALCKEQARREEMEKVEERRTSLLR